MNDQNLNKHEHKKTNKHRNSLTTSDTVTISAVSQIVDFGPTDLNATLGRFDVKERERERERERIE